MLPMALNNYLYQLMKLYILCEVQEHSLSSFWMYFQLYNYVSAFSFTDLVFFFLNSLFLVVIVYMYVQS